MKNLINIPDYLYINLDLNNFSNFQKVKLIIKGKLIALIFSIKSEYLFCLIMNYLHGKDGKIYFENNYYFDSDENTNPNVSQNPYVSSWIWHRLEGSPHYDNNVDLNNPNDYLFAELCCSLGSSIKINWANYQEDNGSLKKMNNKVLRTARVNKTEKIINLNLSINEISVNNIKNDIANSNQIKLTKISKRDIYTLSFYDENMDNIYTIGIGDPFNARVQHIGYEESNIFSLNVPIKNFSIAIPKEINARFISINRRDDFNNFNVIKITEI